MKVFDLSNELLNDLGYILTMITCLFNTLYELLIILIVRTYNYVYVSIANNDNLNFDTYTKEQEQIIINKGYLLFKDVSFKISWKIVEIITIINEYYNKSIIPKFNELTNNYFKLSIIVVKNGDEVLQFRNNKMLLEFEKKNNIDYDFILYTDFHIDNPKKNYTLISYEIINNEYKEIIIPSDVGFIFFQLEYNNIKYDINFKEPKNYLVNDNIIKSDFFNYYMKKTYNIELINDYSVTYMTLDCIQTSIDYPFFIKINKTGVTSFPIK